MKTLLLCILLLTGCATWTTEEKILLGTSCLATAADIVTTMGMRNRGYDEMNPMMSKHPSDGEIVFVLGGGQIATIILAHYWKWFRTWGLGGKTVFNGSLALHNMGLK